jgi:hypothetical protein
LKTKSKTWGNHRRWMWTKTTRPWQTQSLVLPASSSEERGKARMPPAPDT